MDPGGETENKSVNWGWLETAYFRWAPPGNGYISHLGKFGKSSTQNAIFGGYVSFQEGIPVRFCQKSQATTFFWGGVHWVQAAVFVPGTASSAEFNYYGLNTYSGRYVFLAWDKFTVDRPEKSWHLIPNRGFTVGENHPLRTTKGIRGGVGFFPGFRSCVRQVWVVFGWYP